MATPTFNATCGNALIDEMWGLPDGQWGFWTAQSGGYTRGVPVACIDNADSNARTGSLNIYNQGDLCAPFKEFLCCSDEVISTWVRSGNGIGAGALWDWCAGRHDTAGIVGATFLAIMVASCALAFYARRVNPKFGKRYFGPCTRRCGLKVNWDDEEEADA